MSQRISIEEILHTYEKNRLANKRILQERKEEIYAKIPRVEELMTEKKLSYLDIAKRRISKDVPEDTCQEQSNTRLLTEEIKGLLLEAGYPEDYLEPIYTCQCCKDTGYVGLEKCGCFMEQIIQSLYLQSNLSNILLKENFDSFSFEYYNKKKTSDREFSPYDNIVKVVEKAKAFVQAFEDKNNNRGNILIYGETGLGKTFLSNCIAKELLDKKHTVLYLSANELFETVLGGYLMQQKKELEELYKYVYNCELLIIDDLGTELNNNFVSSQLFEIINKRELTGRSTLISTNMSMVELRGRYSERIMSRLIANYTIFNIYGDDIRYQKRKKAIHSNYTG